MNPILGNVLKGFIPMIKGQLGEVDKYLDSYLSAIVLKEGEVRSAILCSMGKDEQGNDKAYILTCTLDANDTPKRVIEKMLVSKFIENIISKI